jgi:hypothetical protein
VEETLGGLYSLCLPCLQGQWCPLEPACIIPLHIKQLLCPFTTQGCTLLALPFAAAHLGGL